MDIEMVDRHRPNPAESPAQQGMMKMEDDGDDDRFHTGKDQEPTTKKHKQATRLTAVVQYTGRYRKNRGARTRQ